MKFLAPLLLLAPLFSVHTSAVAQAESSENTSTTSAPQAQVVFDDPRDPFESFNRAMFDFNYYYLDAYILKPVAIGYRDYVPDLAKTGIINVIDNLEEPSSLVNNTLQGKWGWAANAGGRFLINSTLGLAGLIDVAGYLGMEQKHDDFSEVLGYYGVGNGPYLMLPGMGPVVTREITTDWVDGLYFPLSELTMTHTIAARVIKGIDTRAELLEQDSLVLSAFDPYTFVKDAYLQRVDYKVYDGDVPLSSDDDDLLDDYLDELE